MEGPPGTTAEPPPASAAEEAVVDAVFTATKRRTALGRGGGGVLRALGPGAEAAAPVGRVLSVDEFFDGPMAVVVADEEAAAEGAGEAETAEDVVVYMLHEDESGGPLGGHGVRFSLGARARGGRGGGSSGGSSGEAVQQQPIVHLRKAADIDYEVVGGVARVRTVVGAPRPPPLDAASGVLVQDVTLRPGTEAWLDLPAGYAAAAYIVEGVGIFGTTADGERAGDGGQEGNSKGGSDGGAGDDAEDDGPLARASYQNEGHLLLLRPRAAATRLRVRTHLWSRLRFLLLASPHRDAA